MSASSYLWGIQQSVRGIFKSLGLFSLAIALAGLALFLPIFLGTLYWSFSKTSISVPMHTEITVFAERSAGTKTVAGINEKIVALHNIASTRIMTRAEALKFVNQSLGLKEKKSSANPFPDIIIARVAPNVPSEDIAQTAKEIQSIKGVDSVAYDDQWAKHLSALLLAAKLTLGVLGLVILFLVLLVIAASVRMTTDTQKEELKALYIFGATDAFITRPYVIRGSITLLLSCILAFGLTDLALSLLREPVENFAALYGAKISLVMPSLDWCTLIVLFAGLIGWIISGLATADKLRGIRRVN